MKRHHYAPGVIECYESGAIAAIRRTVVNLWRWLRGPRAF